MEWEHKSQGMDENGLLQWNHGEHDLFIFNHLKALRDFKSDTVSRSDHEWMDESGEMKNGHIS